MTLKEIKDLTDNIFKVDQEIKKDELAVKDKKTILQKLKAKAQLYLDQHDLVNFSTKSCKIYLATKDSVSFPKENEGKEKVFNYIKKKYGRDILNSYLSIHSGKFNTFYNKESELALTNDDNLDFTMPGVDEPSSYTQLKVKKN